MMFAKSFRSGLLPRLQTAMAEAAARLASATGGTAQGNRVILTNPEMQRETGTQAKPAQPMLPQALAAERVLLMAALARAVRHD